MWQQIIIQNIFIWNALNRKLNAINSITLIDYINTDNKLQIEDREKDEKNIAEIQSTSESVEFEDDDVTLHYKELVS